MVNLKEEISVNLLMAFLIGGFVFFTLVAYFVVLIFFPEWVGVSGRDHQKFLDEQKGDGSPQGEEAPKKNSLEP